MSAITGEMLDAGRALALAGLVVAAFHFSREAARRYGKPSALVRALLSAAAIAFVIAALMGKPTCASVDDPLRGACIEHEDNGYLPSQDERTGRFLFWMLLLGVPAGIGVYSSGRRQKAQ